MTKQNYEREKARREFRGKLHEAQQIKHERETVHSMLYLGACLIQERETEAPHETAKTLWNLTKKQAEELVPEVSDA